MNDTIKVTSYTMYESELKRLMKIIAEQSKEIDQLKEEIYDLREALYGG